MPPALAAGTAPLITNWYVPWMPPQTRPAVHRMPGTGGQCPAPGATMVASKCPVTGRQSAAHAGMEETRTAPSAARLNVRFMEASLDSDDDTGRTAPPDTLLLRPVSYTH